MIRVLIVDDSPTIRELIRNILERDHELQVVGEAKNGVEAIELCTRLNPDIITMDVQMPKMSGFEAIRHIMSQSPRPIVILTSTESEIRNGTTFKGMEAGALMVMRKPRGLMGKGLQADQFIAQIKAMAGVKVVRRRWDIAEKTAGPTTKTALPKKDFGRFEILAIGASTGGPPALRKILDQFNGQTSLPVVVVQHISRGFVKGMVRWLADTTSQEVKLAEDGEILKPGTVYFAPDDRHFQISGTQKAWLVDSEPMDGHRPSVTALFNSVALNYGAAAMGVLLTGMGRDGASGLKTIKETGGYTIAQDEKSCVVFGMPKEAIAMGAVNEILPLDQIGKRLRELVGLDHNIRSFI